MRGSERQPGVPVVALVGNPNTGKTTLFNRLCGLRHKTGNFPGTTQEARVGSARSCVVIDLPGVYSLELDASESEVCRAVLAGTLAPAGMEARAPDAQLVVIDATNTQRNLVLLGEALRRRLPTVVALNMMDLARRSGSAPDASRLEAVLQCHVIPCCARTGEGVEQIASALREARIPSLTPPGTTEGLEAWAQETAIAVGRAPDAAQARRSRADRATTDAIDRAVTHPVLGLAIFVGVMFALYWAIFRLADIPMGLIETVFGRLTVLVKSALPAGLLQEFLADGVVAGVGGTLVFLPQICLLFFLISLLEDTGYLARAAFVADRLLRPFGLSGHAFVPMLSSHACALPGIMATRAIPDKRERLAAILVAPFMSCSARIPVYVLVTGILFRGHPAKQSLAMVGCYVLGALAGLASALVARRTVARGPRRAMALELPTYKWPGVGTALIAAWDRGLVFLRKAGTTILAITILLWWLSAFPKTGEPAGAAALREQAAVYASGGEDERAAALVSQADAMALTHARSGSFAGVLGRFVQPVFEPLGFDWRLSVGVITSFAAREVFAGTMGVITAGSEEVGDAGVVERIGSAVRDDGVTPVFTESACWALLVYYVLAMQCLPTLAVTAREAGGVKWAVLQLVWMCGVAYAAAWAAARIAG